MEQLKSFTKYMKYRNTKKISSNFWLEPLKMIQNSLKPPPWLFILDHSRRLSVCLSVCVGECVQVVESFCCLGFSVDRSLWTSQRGDHDDESEQDRQRTRGNLHQQEPVMWRISVRNFTCSGRSHTQHLLCCRLLGYWSSHNQVDFKISTLPNIVSEP